MDYSAFEHHLTSPQGRGRLPADSFTARAGGYACGDEIVVALAVEGDRVADAGFDASGCGAATAAGSAAVDAGRAASRCSTPRASARARSRRSWAG